MVKYIFWTIIFYLMIRFIFNFVIPVYRATRQMKSQVKDFKDRVQEQEQFRAGSNHQSHTKTERKGDYIDFEEVK